MPIDAADLKPLLAQVAAGRSLSEAEAEAAFDIIMSGNATPSQIGAFLMALRVRGETVEEIAGAARIMRAKAVAVEAPPGTIDTCGTGGDSSGSFNISTASALVESKLEPANAIYRQIIPAGDAWIREICKGQYFRIVDLLERYQNRIPRPTTSGAA